MKYDKLRKKFPKLFKRCYPECNEGWYNILRGLCMNIPKKDKIEFTQIKEKFGTLRVYCNRTTDEVDELIECAYLASAETCEMCGSMDKVRQTKGWIKTLCKVCMKGVDKDGTAK